MRSARSDGVRRARRLATAVLAMALLGGCGLFTSSRQPPEPLPVPAQDAAITVARAWTASLGARSAVGFVPAVADGSVWAAAENGTVLRVDAATGSQRWRIELGMRLTSGVGTDGRVAVVASRDGSLVALDAQGSRAWTAAIGAEVVNPPVVAGGLVLVRASDNRVLAVDAATGERRWTFRRQNPPLVLRQAGGITVSGDIAFVGMPGGRVVALELRTGAPRWDVPFAMPRGTTDIERIADVVGAPVVNGRDVCAVTYQGRIGCLDAVSGRPVWARDFSSAAGLDADSSGVVAVDASDRVRAFDTRGQPAWERDGFGRRNLTAPLVHAEAVWVGDFEGNLLAFRRADGRFAARAATDGAPIAAAPAAAGELVVVQTAAGGLFAFRRQ
jgi:outer membrane protein assembly factor BamB